jgi:predicted DsbA family dithiol-disulfide isomerase
MQLEIWSDIACPWCYVGKRRIEAALRQSDRSGEVELTWRSFELDPTAPAERPGSMRDHLAKKYGRTPEDAQVMLDQMTTHAAEDGLDFRFDRTRGANTFDAHRLIHLAATHDRQDAMKERLMRAYHSEGELVSDHATLQRLAEEVGLPAAETSETLAGGRFADDVRADEITAAQLGIRAVPFFVVDREFGAAGAHPPEALAEMLSKAARI